ncbi:MAG TPA: hypothetical protein VJ673_23780 [Aromatoleum sp.]|uniref:hypothetical protein n=1 Tax=Aromatoleum sp. TaxID=2307007 RepID=UPI002B49B1C7|nr:hypothetical protein [Aromatoleum sp.]HJV28720.1 hypothetical protein [Aromatoleum sp.]
MLLFRLTLIATGAMVAACSTPSTTATRTETEPTPSVLGVPETTPPPLAGQLDFKLASGVYSCDMGQRINIVRPAGEAIAIEIGWTGRRYQLARNISSSGLPRYEDKISGLVWIDLPWKGMLLDAKTNKPLASDCTTTM